MRFRARSRKSSKIQGTTRESNNVLRTCAKDCLSRFKAKVNVYAEMWRDSLMSPVEEATYWTEILAKYRNLDHLIINDSHLNTVQYFSIDVIMFLIALVVLAASLIFKGLNRLISLGSAKLKID